MKALTYILLLVTTLFGCVSTWAYTLAGDYEFSESDKNGTFTLSLNCQSESECMFTNTSSVKNQPPHVTEQKFQNIHLTTDKLLALAAGSLDYAVRNFSGPHTTQDDLMLVRRLQAVLSTNPSISKCWTLGKERIPMQACTLSNVPLNSAPLYLFLGSMSNCREPADAFCGYAIFPLSSSR